MSQLTDRFLPKGFSMPSVDQLPEIPELWKIFRTNLKSGITVSLVSVPLSLALATASGSDPARGYQAAFWSGLFAAICGGSEYNIVGPTGALSGVLLTASAATSDDALPILALGSAFLCFVMWFFHLTRFIMLVPSSVMEGFTLGVGCIIAFGQLPAIFGLRGLVRHTEFLSNVFESLSHLHETHLPTMFFFLINFSLLLGLSYKWPKTPWSIAVACVGILFGWLSDSGHLGSVQLITLQTLYGDIPRRVARQVQWSYLWKLEPALMASSSGGICFITILETLISARIADQQTGTQHKQEREVFGIAIANFACALTGSMPCTAALARTSLNINAGATSRLSGVINSIMVLFLSLALMPLFKHLPMATIAALLVMVAYKMMSFHEVMRFWKYNRLAFAICLLCATLCLVVDTVVGLVVGALASLLIFAERMSHSFSDISVHTPDAHVEHLSLKRLAAQERKFEEQHEHSLWHRPSVSSTSPVPEQEPEEPDAALSPCVLRDAPQFEGNTFVNLVPRRADGTPVPNTPTTPSSNVLLYQIAGLLNYVNAKAHQPHIRYLAATSPVGVVCLHLQFLFYVDLDGVDALHDYIKTFRATGKTVLLTGATQGNVPKTLRSHSWFMEMLAQGHVFDTYQDALDAHGCTE